MVDEGSKKKKKKRGRSLILKTLHIGPSKHSADHKGKKLASDDNLVYSDVTSDSVEPDAIKKSASSRGRMSRIFKAVLFDTAVKNTNGSGKESEGIDNLSRENDLKIVKNLEENNSSDDKSEEIDNLSHENNSSNDKFNNMYNDNNLNMMKKLEEYNSSNDISNVIPPSPKKVKHQVASTVDSSTNTSSQTLTVRKVTSRVDSMDKKPPLPSNSRPSVKPIAQKESKHATSNNNQTFRMCLFFIVGVLVMVALWLSYQAISAKSSDVIDSGQYTNVDVVDSGQYTNVDAVDSGQYTNVDVVDSVQYTNVDVVDSGQYTNVVVVEDEL